jgi:hypothetical protein
LGDTLQKDATFDCREGARTVVRGKVLEVQGIKG